MRVYLASAYTSGFDLQGSIYRKLTLGEQEARRSVGHFLESFYYLNKQPEHVAAIRRDGVRIFVDSGAFSARNGARIDLDAYCRFIRDHEDIIETVDGRPMVAVLDKIGDADATRRKQVAMQKQGISAIPVFHFDSDPRHLQEYVRNFDYVALGGLADNRISTSRKRDWLDKLFEKHIRGSTGRPQCRTHLFGVMSLELLQRYRSVATSVDSTTWLNWAGNGMVLMPRGQVAISNASDGKSGHFDEFNEAQRGAMLATITGAGFELDRLREFHYSRWAWNARAFAALGA